MEINENFYFLFLKPNTIYDGPFSCVDSIAVICGVCEYNMTLCNASMWRKLLALALDWILHATAQLKVFVLKSCKMAEKDIFGWPKENMHWNHGFSKTFWQYPRKSLS